MAEPLSTSATVGTVAGWGIVTSALVAFITSVDYSIAFGAFAGSMCFIVTASDLTRRQIFGYFLFGYAAGIYGAGFVADKVEGYLEYREKRLDALAAGQSLCRIMTAASSRALQRQSAWVSKWLLRFLKMSASSGRMACMCSAPTMSFTKLSGMQHWLGKL